MGVAEAFFNFGWALNPKHFLPSKNWWLGGKQVTARQV